MVDDWRTLETKARDGTLTDDERRAVDELIAYKLGYDIYTIPERPGLYIKVKHTLEPMPAYSSDLNAAFALPFKRTLVGDPADGWTVMAFENGYENEPTYECPLLSKTVEGLATLICFAYLHSVADDD